MSKFLQMRHSHSYVLYSPSFYTSVFGYRLCLRWDCIFTVPRTTVPNAWSDNVGKWQNYSMKIHYIDGDMLHWMIFPLYYTYSPRCNVTIAQGNEEHLGLFIHVVRGDNDDALRWPMQVKEWGSNWSSVVFRPSRRGVRNKYLTFTTTVPARNYIISLIA